MDHACCSCSCCCAVYVAYLVIDCCCNYLLSVMQSLDWSCWVLHSDVVRCRTSFRMSISSKAYAMNSEIWSAMIKTMTCTSFIRWILLTVIWISKCTVYTQNPLLTIEICIEIEVKIHYPYKIVAKYWNPPQKYQNPFLN